MSKAEYEYIAVDPITPEISQITLNRPEKRNAINNRLRADLLDALQSNDQDPRVRVSILRGAGPCFSSGYDLKSDLSSDRPYFTPDVGHSWARHVTEGWLSLWDLSKPVIAQIHGYAMAGGLELVGACDLAYAANDASLSHPVTRIGGLPDFAHFPVTLSHRDALEFHLTGREYSGIEAERIGLINRAFPADELEERVREIAERIASIPPEVVKVNKRFVYSTLEQAGGRAAIRNGADLQAGPHMQSGRSEEEIHEMVRALNRERGTR